MARIDKLEQVLSVVVSHTPSISNLGIIREFIATSASFFRHAVSGHRVLMLVAPGMENQMDSPGSPYAHVSITPRGAELLSRPPTPKRQSVDPDHGRMSGSAEDDDGGIGKGWLGTFDGSVDPKMAIHRLTQNSNAVPETVRSRDISSSTLADDSQMKGNRNVALNLDVHGTPAENLQVCQYRHWSNKLTVVSD